MKTVLSKAIHIACGLGVLFANTLTTKAVSEKTKITMLVLTVLFATVTATPSFAINDDDRKAEISYIGNRNDMPVYRLALKSKADEVYFISVTDYEGNVLYNERLKGTNIVRNYQFKEEVFSEYDLIFTILDNRGKTLSAYNVNKSKKIIDEVAVNRLK